MNPTNEIVLSGVVVTVGRWAEGKTIDIKLVIGISVVVLSLAALTEANENLARQIALLILVSSVLRYGLVITKKAGLTK